LATSGYYRGKNDLEDKYLPGTLTYSDFYNSGNKWEEVGLGDKKWLGYEYIPNNDPADLDQTVNMQR
jgi:hypothetical protein